MPLKAEAARLADTLSPTAARSGSVNTLMRTGDVVAGESTDSRAFDEILSLQRFAERTSVLVLGTGGSAAAALAALAEEPNVYLSGRNGGAVDVLTQRLGGEAVAWGSAVAGALVINATSLGMAGEPLAQTVLDMASGLIDLPYGDQETPAVSRARAVGLALVDGHEFLLRQAIGSFGLWTGVTIDLETLSTRLRNT
jgi:shikimate dehydrogenase